MISPPNETVSRTPWIVAVLFIALIGIFLRVSSFEHLEGVGYDEAIYASYVEQAAKVGPLAYPQMIDLYLTKQKNYPIAFLPPTRTSFILTAAAWDKAFGSDEAQARDKVFGKDPLRSMENLRLPLPTVETLRPLRALRTISCFASIAILAISAIFAWRLGGSRASFAITALMAFAPTQVSMAHRSLIDGFFGMMALLVIWSLWEVLQNPKSRGWLCAYALSLCLMVLTKENAAFVYLAVLGLLITNRWLRFGTITRSTLLATIAGPCAGALLLALCAGGFVKLLTLFELNVRMTYLQPYATLNQDGPWFRYLIDLFLVSPLVMLFAIGGAFLVNRANKPALFLLLFILLSYFVMGNLRYGINLRFANMWDFPLRWLAIIPIFAWRESISRVHWQRVIFFGTVGLLTLFEFGNYLQIFVDHDVYDPISLNLMHALDMIKFPGSSAR